jgi:ABC-2 type transport system permease protein
MKFIRVLAIARIYSSWFLASRLWLVNQLIIPFAMYIIFSLAVGRGFEIYALIGATVSLSWGAGANAVSQQLFHHKYNYRIKDMFVASPLHPLEYALGCGLGALLNAALPAIPVFILLVLYVGQLMIHAVMVFVISWLMGTLLGFWLGNSARDPARLGAAANVLHFLLIMLPPVYYPVSVLPEWASHLALLVPTASLSHILSCQLALAQSP